ncbi:Diguanylate cyclase [Burkholderiales bacterium 8X]|nr:Diguanylate cyclase [Burkholderiales bacterium 8X]
MSMRDTDWTDQGSDDLERRITRLVSATADGGDTRIDRAVREVLRLVRDHLQMEVAFVSEVTEGRRIFRHVDTEPGKELIAVGASDPLALSFCQRVLDGRMPQMVRDVSKLPDFDELPQTPWPIGAHLSTPIVLASGQVYGTLCAFSRAPNEDLTQRDLKRLQMSAQMVARLIDQQRLRDRGAA